MISPAVIPASSTGLSLNTAVTYTPSPLSSPRSCYLGNPDGVTEDWLDAGTFEIEVAAERIPATASLRSFYDPDNERVRL